MHLNWNILRLILVKPKSESNQMDGNGIIAFENASTNFEWVNRELTFIETIHKQSRCLCIWAVIACHVKIKISTILLWVITNWNNFPFTCQLVYYPWTIYSSRSTRKCQQFFFVWKGKMLLCQLFCLFSLEIH